MLPGYVVRVPLVVSLMLAALSKPLLPDWSSEYAFSECTEFSEVVEGFVPVVLLGVLLALICHHMLLRDVFSRIHFYNKMNNIVYVWDRSANGLAEIMVLVQISAVHYDVSWWRPWPEEICLCVRFIPWNDLASRITEISQHLLDGAVGVSKLLFIEIFDVLIIDAGDYFLHADICDRLLHLVRLLQVFWLIFKCHDLKWGGGGTDGASRYRRWV